MLSIQCKEERSYTDIHQVRCREVDWRSRWYWGLEILNAETASDQSHNQGAGTSQTRTPAATQTQTQTLGTFSTQQYPGKEIEKWLTSLRISAKEEEKPALLHAVVLHLIKWGRYRSALDELET